MAKKKRHPGFELRWRNADGTPFTPAPLDETEQARLKQNWELIRARIERLDEAKLNPRPVEEGSTWEEIRDILEAGKQKTARDFEELLPTVKAFLEKQAMLLPRHAGEFFDWFLRVKHGNRLWSDILKYWPEVTRRDFIEFHEYQYKEMMGGTEEPTVLAAPKTQEEPAADHVEPPAVTFETLFFTAADMRTALEAAKAVGLITDTGVWANAYDKGNGLTAFWKAITADKLAHPDISARKVAEAFKTEFKMDRLGKNMVSTKWNPEYLPPDYRRLYTDLRAYIRENRPGK